MNTPTLRDRLRAAREDDRITRAEVESFIRSVLQDGTLTHQEALTLHAEMDAHESLFDPDALHTLQQFLNSHAASMR